MMMLHHEEWMQTIVLTSECYMTADVTPPSHCQQSFINGQKQSTWMNLIYSWRRAIFISVAFKSLAPNMWMPYSTKRVCLPLVEFFTSGHVAGSANLQIKMGDKWGFWHLPSKKISQNAYFMELFTYSQVHLDIIFHIFVLLVLSFYPTCRTPVIWQYLMKSWRKMMIDVQHENCSST